MEKEEREEQLPGLVRDSDFFRSEMKHIVESLNTSFKVVEPASEHRNEAFILDVSELQRELRRRVEAWMESGPNLQQLFKTDPALAERTYEGRTQFLPTTSGAGYLAWLPSPASSSSQTDQGLSLFMALIANQQWELLARCTRCRQYYLKNTKRQKVYCTRKCGSGTTARTAVRQSRRIAHEKKIGLAQSMIQKWLQTHPKKPWKEYVSRSPSLTKKWLTRMVNKGDLIEPGLEQRPDGSNTDPKLGQMLHDDIGA